MRARGMAITAQNESEFYKMIHLRDFTFSCRSNQPVNDHTKEDEDSSEDDNLGYDRKYKLTLHQTSLEEEDTQDEDSLGVDSHIGAENSTMESDEEKEKEKEKEEKVSSLEISLKILLIGDKSSGKTFFLRNYIEKRQTLDIETTERTFPTTSLEIHKKNYYFEKKNIKVEYIDTNFEILNSSLISTYLKICNAFILVCDIANLRSITFLEHQLENIINYSHTPKNIFLLVNHSDPSAKLTDEWSSYFNGLLESYQIKEGRVNLLSNFGEEKVLRFIDKCASRERTRRSTYEQKRKINLSSICI